MSREQARGQVQLAKRALLHLEALVRYAEDEGVCVGVSSAPHLMDRRRGRTRLIPGSFKDKVVQRENRHAEEQ